MSTGEVGQAVDAMAPSDYAIRAILDGLDPVARGRERKSGRFCRSLPAPPPRWENGNAGMAGYDFAEDFLGECERMITALEALDPAAPQPVETIRALAKRMDRLGANFCRNVLMEARSL